MRTGFAYLDDHAGPVIAFAHRGGAYHPEIEGLENTMAAFRHAVALGFTYLETDVHTTRDGELLAFHDTVLDRMTDAVGEIGRLSYAEVREARIGGTEHVPRLIELVEAFPRARFNIDLKSDGAVVALADLIDVHDLAERVLVGSFSLRRLTAFRRRTQGRVPTSAAPPEVVVFRLLPSGRLADLVTRGRVAALQVPHRRGRLVVTNHAFVRRAHAAGKHVHVWTIDDPEEITELLDRGVDGIFTDRTDVLREVLVGRGQWP